ncbi:hypothetical protein [Streptomyces tanashiensis]|uniref:hypothetical protein n=1 Tax=Streptomyces tanashiensis TaxID=67367 RepID=UPI00341C08DB
MADPGTPFHDEPFPELCGHVTEVATSADGQWIAASSVLSNLSRVVVYRAADLSCAHLLTVAMESDSMAFHPTLPLLGIGFDNGDEYQREGALTLLEPATGHRVDFADPDRGVELIRWLDDRTLELTFFAEDPDDEYGYERSRATAVREDWLGLTPDVLDLTALDPSPLAPDEPLPFPDTGPALERLQALAGRAGRSYDGRGGVRSVAGLSDGRVLATRNHTTLECWSPAGSLMWSVPAPTAIGGTRIEVAADERTVRVAVPGPDRRTRTDFPLVDASDGTVLDCPSVPFSAGMFARADGVWTVKDTYDRSYGTEDPSPNTRVYAADGAPLGTAHEPDRYELVPVDVRRCPELLFTRRRRRDVFALDPRTAAETPLFATEAPLGVAVYVDDASGPALLHGQEGLLRRRFPTGDVVWHRPLDAVVTALDAHDDVAHALCADSTLVSVDTADGTVLERRTLPPYGLCSLGVAPDGTVLVGTAAGRILRY